MAEKQAKTLQICFESDNGIITLTNGVDKVFDHFRQMLIKLLDEKDFSVEWHDGNCENCDISIKLVQLDQGQSSLRSFLHWIPLMSPIVCLFPVTFEVEVTILQTDSKPRDFHYVETHRNAVVDSVMMLEVCSSKITPRICEDISSVLI